MYFVQLDMSRDLLALVGLELAGGMPTLRPATDSRGLECLEERNLEVESTLKG